MKPRGDWEFFIPGWTGPGRAQPALPRTDFLSIVVVIDLEGAVFDDDAVLAGILVELVTHD
jgi:hypothetical protein